MSTLKADFPQYSLERIFNMRDNDFAAKLLSDKLDASRMRVYHVSCAKFNFHPFQSVREWKTKQNLGCAKLLCSNYPYSTNCMEYTRTLGYPPCQVARERSPSNLLAHFEPKFAAKVLEVGGGIMFGLSFFLSVRYGLAFLLAISPTL